MLETLSQNAPTIVVIGAGILAVCILLVILTGLCSDSADLEQNNDREAHP